MIFFTLSKNETEDFERLLPAEYAALVDTPHIFTLGALDDETYPLGVLQFFAEEKDGLAPTARILWFYVAEEARGEGVGEGLLQRFYRAAFASGLGTASMDLIPETHADLAAFLKNKGAAFEEESSPCFEMPLSAVKELCKSYPKVFSGCQILKKYPSDQSASLVAKAGSVTDERILSARIRLCCKEKKDRILFQRLLPVLPGATAGTLVHILIRLSVMA